MARTFMSLFQTQLDDPDMQDFMSSIEQTMDGWIVEILNLVMLDVVTYLQSYTSKKNPPRYRRKFFLNVDSARVKVTKKNVGSISPDRPAHPGGWSDVEGDLRKGYYGRVEKGEGGGWKLIIGNRNEAAAFVEAMQGLFVVTGVFEKNGPVIRALNKYLKMYAPGNKITNRFIGSEVTAKGTGIVDSVTASAL